MPLQLTRRLANLPTRQLANSPTPLTPLTPLSCITIPLCSGRRAASIALPLLSLSAPPPSPTLKPLLPHNPPSRHLRHSSTKSFPARTAPAPSLRSPSRPMASASPFLRPARFASLRSTIWSKANKSPPRPANPARPPISSGRPTPPPSPSFPIATPPPTSPLSPISSSLISTAIPPIASPNSMVTSTRRLSLRTERASRFFTSRAPHVPPARSPRKHLPPASSEKITSRFSAWPLSRPMRPNPLLPASSRRPTFTSSSSIGRPTPNPSPTLPPTLLAKTTGGSPNSIRKICQAHNEWVPLIPRTWGPGIARTQLPPSSFLPPTSPARSTACRSPFLAGRPTANPSPSSPAS